MPSLKITGNYTGCGIGVFLEDGDPTSSEIDSYESLISKEVAVVMWFKDFTCDFPTASCEMIYNHKCIPMITWEPWKWASTEVTYSLENINAGNCDAYIQTFANAAKSWGKPLFLRFAHEMNGNWYPWSGALNGSDEAATSKYKAAWRRIYATFEALGVTNVTWVWCPNNFDDPIASWNTAESYYPGDSYVDWIGIDGYSCADWNGCASFDTLFDAIYNTFNSYGKPMMIGEMARSPDTDIGGKPSWIIGTFSKIHANYTNIKLYVWFNKNKEYDWSVNSSPESLSAFRAAMTDEAYYLSTIH